MAASRGAIDLGASLGAAVLGLLERAGVPPEPAFYSLVYNYVSGVQGLLSSRVGEILGRGDVVGGTVSQQLYAEFVAPYENRDAIERQSPISSAGCRRWTC